MNAVDVRAVSTDADELLLREVGKFAQVDWATAATGVPATVDTNARLTYVYVLVAEKDGMRVPFYIGQTTRLAGRVKDYKYGGFKAATDFRVNRAIQFFEEKPHECNIKLLYREFEAHKIEERRLIEEFFLHGFPLLNHLDSYQYGSTKPDIEEKPIQRFCAMALGLARVKQAAHV